MATAPYGVRLLVGAAVTALDETRKLPQTILTYPMTVASQLAHLVMKVQQDVADLVNRGDEALEELFPPKDEQPEWATFDEDEPRDRFSDAADADDADDLASVTRLTGNKVTNRSEGRFALFSEGEAHSESYAQAHSDAPGAATAPTSNGEVPAIVDKIGYETLTLAQLRARLTSLKLTDLEALLAFEEANKARAPFQTLIANRITRASAK